MAKGLTTLAVAILLAGCGPSPQERARQAVSIEAELRLTELSIENLRQRRHDAEYVERPANMARVNAINDTIAARRVSAESLRQALAKIRR